MGYGSSESRPEEDIRRKVVLRSYSGKGNKTRQAVSRPGHPMMMMVPLGEYRSHGESGKNVAGGETTGLGSEKPLVLLKPRIVEIAVGRNLSGS